MRSRTVLIVVLAAAAVGVAVLAAKQNPVGYTEVDPSIEPILPEMVRIPEGPFLRGNPTGTDEEKPVRTIWVSEFSIGKHEVTNAEWKRFVDATGRDFHLPTEAQWEKAARGGLDGSEFFWGNDRRDGMARHALSWSEGPVAVGSYPPNGYGLHDVAGNVNEMVHDWYDDTYFGRGPKRDPTGPNGWLNYFSLLDPVGRSRTKGRCHVVRGGSYRAP